MAEQAGVDPGRRVRLFSDPGPDSSVHLFMVRDCHVEVAMVSDLLCPLLVFKFLCRLRASHKI